MIFGGAAVQTGSSLLVDEIWHAAPAGKSAWGLVSGPLPALGKGEVAPKAGARGT